MITPTICVSAYALVAIVMAAFGETVSGPMAWSVIVIGILCLAFAIYGDDQRTDPKRNHLRESNRLLHLATGIGIAFGIFSIVMAGGREITLVISSMGMIGIPAIFMIIGRSDPEEV